MLYLSGYKRGLVDMVKLNKMRYIMLYNIWQFCKEYPGWAAAFFFCGWLIGSTVKYSMQMI